MRLLRTVSIGRIGFNANALPVVLPVAFSVDGDSLVIRTCGGSQMDDAIRDGVVAFEADDADGRRVMGWSVSITGVAREITDGDEIERVQRLPLAYWTDGRPSRLIRISLDLMSGRRSGARSRIGVVRVNGADVASAVATDSSLA